MAKVVNILVPLSDDVPDEWLSKAEAKAKEAAILALQQEGVLTIREAAQALGLGYEEYLALLAERNLPATCDATDPDLRFELLRKAGKGATSP